MQDNGVGRSVHNRPFTTVLFFKHLELLPLASGKPPMPETANSVWTCNVFCVFLFVFETGL